jgi:CheY-like chemotaxis protein
VTHSNGSLKTSGRRLDGNQTRGKRYHGYDQLMAKILVAASPEPRAILERILAGHDLSCAGSMAQAEQFLRERTFDLIICTVAFDESRMFEFLRLAKATREWQQIPFVCARVRGHILRSPTAVNSTAFTCGALGAQAFLDIENYASHTDPEQSMRQEIERLLPA